MATEPELNEIEVNADEDAGEDVIEQYVPYIHNGYILDMMTKDGNAATARMLLLLPLCPSSPDNQSSVSSMKSSLTRLKKRRDKLLKKKSTDGIAAYEMFLKEDFVFPVPSGAAR